MSVPVLDTRAVIEDYEKGKIGEIIFDNYGYCYYFFECIYYKSVRDI